MSDEGTTGSGQIPGWWTPDQAGGIPAESNVDAATRMPNSASPSPGEPKKRWSLVLLTAISLVVLTAGGTIIALKLGSDEPGTTSTNQEAATPTTKRTATTESSGSSEAAGLDDAAATPTSVCPTGPRTRTRRPTTGQRRVVRPHRGPAVRTRWVR